MQNNGHAGWLEPGGSISPGPTPPSPTRLWGGGYGGGGLLTAPPAPAGAGPGVALKIHHEVTDKPPPAAPGRAPPPAGRGTGLFQSMAAGQRNGSGSRGPGGTPRTPRAHGCEDGAGSSPFRHHRMPWPSPGSCAGNGGMNGERGWGCASTILPLAKTPNSHNAPGLRWAAGAGEGLRAERGWRRSCPGHTARLLVSHLGHLLRLPPAPRCGSGCIKPRRSLLSPPRVLHEQRRGEEPLGQTATEPKTRRKGKREWGGGPNYH